MNEPRCDRCHFLITEGTVHIPTSRNGCQIKVSPSEPEVGPSFDEITRDRFSGEHNRPAKVEWERDPNVPAPSYAERRVAGAVAPEPSRSQQKRVAAMKGEAAPTFAPEPPLCPVCKVTPMMRDAGGDWECPNRTVGGPHSRFATGEVREAPEPKPELRCYTTQNLCGTDTWAGNWRCNCKNCQRYLAEPSQSGERAFMSAEELILELVIALKRSFAMKPVMCADELISRAEAYLQSAKDHERRDK